eukprot:gnl/TRDRNA2_/TRDRNA2_139278_c0_seq1.p1 gnl/TRDRNA2_/TRDRNA2_139278_c0~~gnl/TRDRNA2_/TRDRNA2_139278_c0_seq1.p1  ORF type:complete len:139 (+),score=38.31 gnl/TRDRNA2_/TRDRNA2_139278_c0_seq1:2-418(+)
MSMIQLYVPDDYQSFAQKAVDQTYKSNADRIMHPSNQTEVSESAMPAAASDAAAAPTSSSASGKFEKKPAKAVEPLKAASATLAAQPQPVTRSWFSASSLTMMLFVGSIVNLYVVHQRRLRRQREEDMAELQYLHLAA